MLKRISALCCVVANGDAECSTAAATLGGWLKSQLAFMIHLSEKPGGSALMTAFLWLLLSLLIALQSLAPTVNP